MAQHCIHRAHGFGFAYREASGAQQVRVRFVHQMELHHGTPKDRGGSARRVVVHGTAFLRNESPHPVRWWWSAMHRLAQAKHRIGMGCRTGILCRVDPLCVVQAMRALGAGDEGDELFAGEGSTRNIWR